MSITFAHLDARALGIACGAVMGFGVFLATAVLLLRDQKPVGPNLALLGQYFLGYRVTWIGSLLGALYGFLTGFLLGYAVAAARNLFARAYLFFLRRRIENASDELP